MKFFPQEVESVLESHPAIQEASVFGYRDKLLGEVPYAQLVKASICDNIPTEDEFRDFCASHLAMYKIPEKFHFVDTLLRTASGKLIRNASRLLNKDTEL
jgi:long-chain acyl-CoA synthetase